MPPKLKVKTTFGDKFNLSIGLIDVSACSVAPPSSWLSGGRSPCVHIDDNEDVTQYQKVKERKNAEIMKFLPLFLSLTLTESQFVIRPEDLTAGLEDQALLVCAAKSGGKFFENRCRERSTPQIKSEAFNHSN